MSNLDPRQHECLLLAENSDGTFHLDGVRWGFHEHDGPYHVWTGRFSDAVVDSNWVREVYITIEPFAPEWLAAHAFIEFEFEPGAEVRNAQGETDPGLVVSVEARVPRGHEFGLVTGVMRAFRIVYQVSTWCDVVQKSCRGMGHKLIRHKLALTPEQRRAMLRNTLHRATADHSHEFYNTLTNSCLTSAIKEINSCLPWRQRVWSWLLPGVPNLAAALPRTADIVLTARHALTTAPCKLTQPEQSLWPENQATNNAITRVAATLSNSPLWRPAARVVGFTAATRAGRALGVRGATLVGLGIFGQWAARVVADLIKSRAHTRFEPSEPYLRHLAGEARRVPRGV